jgi:hypothetical protein
LGWTKCAGADFRHEGCEIEKWTAGGVAFYTTVPRVVRARLSDLLRRLVPTFGSVLIVDREFLVSAQAPPEGTTVVRSVGDLATRLQLTLDAPQAERLRRVLFEVHRPRRVGEQAAAAAAAQTNAHVAYANRFFEAMARGEHIPAPDPDLFEAGNTGFMFFTTQRAPQRRPRPADIDDDDDDEEYDDDDDEDEDYLRAQEESIAMAAAAAAATEAPSQRQRRRLNPTWEETLKEAEVAKPGDPVCITCRENRASILFAECCHQVMCDVCVRQMWTLPGVRRECPVCKDAVDTIKRPFLAEKL